MNHDAALHDWASKVEDGLPWECPACDEDLGKIRYVTDCSRMVVHLTGAVNETAIHKALCPHCDHVLASEAAGERRVRL